jgi:hypothetical protein
LNVTLPLPAPVVAEVNAIHEASVVAVHWQPGPDVTEIVPLPPDAGTLCVSGETVNVQPCPWMTVTFWPATLIVADRVGPFVGATVNVTVPGPVTLAPAVIVIH